MHAIHPTQSLRRTVVASLAASVLIGAFGSGSALAQSPKVELKTNHGAIVIELYPDKAPKSVENFLEYVNSGHYSGTVFHRVIDGFMIQGGGFAPGMKQKPTRAPIPLESKNGLKNDRGTLAMARTSDPNSATAQFFINVANNDMLNFPKPDGNGYAVFGKVVTGMDVVDAIRKVQTGQHPAGHGDVPVKDVVIQSATLVDKK
jgi:peptidyl-prolyl cis-trans isomerase A (cyclophilin A)